MVLLLRPEIFIVQQHPVEESQAREVVVITDALVVVGALVSLGAHGFLLHSGCF